MIAKLDDRGGVVAMISERIIASLGSLKNGNENFQHAHETYVQQYGNDKIVVNEPVALSGTIEPVILIFGEASLLRFRDSKKELEGSQGSYLLAPNSVYIVGRREPQDSRLVLWDCSDNSEKELEEYDARASVIPSRVHGAFVSEENGEVFYTDLSSSSGTVIFGELSQGGPFVRIYDPGTRESPRYKVSTVHTSRKG